MPRLSFRAVPAFLALLLTTTATSPRAQSATPRDTCSPANAVLFAHVGSDADFDCASDANPGGPVNGQNWIATVQIQGGDDLSVVTLHQGPIPCTVTGGLFSGGFLGSPGPFLYHLSLSGTHCISIPAGAGIAGLSLSAQGASVDIQPLHFTLSNALDLVIG